MVQAVMLDFYGTVVHEDDVVIEEICAAIKDSSSTRASASEIGSHWWSVLSHAFKTRFGETFRTQRDLERSSLDETCQHFNASVDSHQLSELMFDHWQASPLFDDARSFLATVDLPIVVLSNIDRVDIEAAIAAHGLELDLVITSDDVRSYKPRPELFRAGLEALGLGPSDVLHVGDSVTSDVAGAISLGIPVAWVNRKGKPPPTGSAPDLIVSTLTELIPVLRPTTP